MKLVKVSELFEISYGDSLELNKLQQSIDGEGINYVSRTAKNNGVSAVVKRLDEIEPTPSGVITVSLGGSVLETFLQPKQFYTGYHIYILNPKIDMTDQQKLFYCMSIKANRYRYSYGRQANRTLKDILVPDISAIPPFVDQTDLDKFNGAKRPVLKQEMDLNIDDWKPFRYDSLFTIERGRGPRKKDLDGSGSVPFITSSDSNNGLTNFTSMEAIHEGNTIGVNRNGSVAEAFYQTVPFCSTEDVHIFTPKFKINQYIAMFLNTLIRLEKYRYNYGRKWGIERMKNSIIKLPVDNNGEPDWNFMETYIKTLNYSSSI